MVKIVHSFNNLKIGKNVKEDISFILTNKEGSYIYLSEKPISRYQGMFFFEKFKMYKVIENINLIETKPITEITNNFYSVERKRKNITEGFFMPYNFNSLVYELNEEKEIEITLDAKGSYDNRAWGRHYEIFEEKGCIMVKFAKNTDYREDNTDGMEEFTLYLAIKCNGSGFKRIEKWVEHCYKLDQQRNSTPFNRYVYHALNLKGKKFVFSVSRNKDKAIKECRHIFRNADELRQKQEKIFAKNIHGNSKNMLKKIGGKERKFAYVAAVNSLSCLAIRSNKNHYVLAGLPWFFQNWARDEIISLKALMIMKRNDVVKSILRRRIGSINENSSISSKNGSTINSADATGWLFKRMEEFKGLSGKNIKLPIAKLKNIVDLLVSKQTYGNFALNSQNETWMDSEERSGIRVEIQALRLFTYKMMRNLTKQKIYEYSEDRLKNSIKEKLWNGKYLYDGLNDATIRPNVFMAYYIYPDLLAKKEWIKCFEAALKALWLEWGGVSTIDKKSPLFQKEHSGEDNSSYHKGDSWFWLNNLAALALYKLDKNRFRKYKKPLRVAGLFRVRF